MNRRNFLQIMLATASAPAIVRAASLMPIYVPKPVSIWDLVGSGVNLHTWHEEELISLGMMKPNQWIQDGLIWTLDAEIAERRILAAALTSGIIMPECIRDTSCGK